MFELLFLVGIVVCGGGLALLLGHIFGGGKRTEYYGPSPAPGNERRYWVKPKL